MNNKYTYVLLPIIIIIACFVLWSPSQLMITDEISYYFQAKFWLHGNSNNTIIDAINGTTHSLIEGHYPPGNSFFLSAFMNIDNSLVHFLGLIYLLGAILFLYKCLKTLNLPFISLCAIYLFIPLIFISRTTMSEMPSLLLVSWGVYLYYKNTATSYLWLAFITGMSLAFRETNLLLLAPLAFYMSRNYFYSVLAFLVGLSFRLIGYYIIKTDPVFLKEGYPFGIEFIPDTIIIYAAILLLLLPLSPLWFTKVPREELKAFTVGILSFLGLHLIYGYVAHVYSGYTNGLLLNGRFWIPALPIFVMALGYFLKDKKWLNKKWVTVLIILIITLTNAGVHYKSFDQQSDYLQFRNTLKENTNGHVTFIDMNSRTPIYRYIYPFVMDRRWSDINLVNDTYHLQETFKENNSFRIALISSGATVAQSTRNAQFYNKLEKLKDVCLVNHLLEICPTSSSCLNIYEVNKK